MAHFPWERSHSTLVCLTPPYLFPEKHRRPLLTIWRRHLTCRRRSGSRYHSSCWMVELQCFQNLHSKKPRCYPCHSSRAPRPSASLIGFSPIISLFLPSLRSFFILFLPSHLFYKTFIAFIVCVISRNIIFWAPTVGFGHRRSCFSATTFGLCLKVDWTSQWTGLNLNWFRPVKRLMKN